ncbi:hypothetical protein ACI6Q2_15405 [Chitinophagaceae bacterium LWZ2-11]
MKIYSLAVLSIVCSVSISKAQYVEKERDDTVRLYAKTPFDTTAAKYALAFGKSTIKGVAFTKPKTNLGYKAPFANRIYANKITVLLFPVTPYLLDYLDVKKKENPKKLKFAYIDPSAWRCRLEAVTNSVGEFTFPDMKPGKYYLEAILPWTTSGYTNQYTGSGYNSYGGTTDYYQRQYYSVGHYDKLVEFIEIKNDGDIVKVKLN